MIERNTLYTCSVVKKGLIFVFSVAASSFFALRNVDKTKNQEGEIGRSAVAVGQTAGVLQEIAKLDGAVAKTARSALSVFSDLAKENKAFKYAGKATQFAVNNVNPLICASGVIKTALSDDKIQTGVTEAAALASMFIWEETTKKHYNDIINSTKCKNMVESASKTSLLKPVFEFLEKHKLKGKAGALVKALTFVSASMTGYTIGENYGGNLASKVKNYLGDNKA